MSLEDQGDYGYPLKPEHPGKPGLQKYQEAQARCEERHKWQRAHPGEYYNDDWEQRSKDYDAIERGEHLLGGGLGAHDFEPGDAFCSGKEDK